MVMMVVRLGIEAPALAALHNDAMGVVVGDIDQEPGLAGPAAIGLVAAAFARGRAGRVFEHVSPVCLGRGEQDHVELGHGGEPRRFPCRDGETPELSTASFSLPAHAAAVYRSDS